MGAMRPALRRTATASALAAVVVLAFAASALALSGTPIKIAFPKKYASAHPAVAVNSSGTAYIAWINEEELHGEGPTVEYCVIPTGASVCAYQGAKIIEDGKGYIFGNVRILIDGSTVSMFAGEVATKGEEYEPMQEWQATDGTGEFKQVLGGKSVAKPGNKPPFGADEEPVIIPGSGEELGFGSAAPAFDEFPLFPKEECSGHSCPVGEQPVSLLSELREKEFGSVYTPISFASITSGSDAGILGVYQVSSIQTECGDKEGFLNQLGFVYGTGAQTSTNSYAIAPGLTDSAWKNEVTHSDCEVDNFVVAGGPSGFGLVENDETRGYTVYQPFDETHGTFDAPLTTIAKEKESQPSLSQDGSGNLYLTYSNFNGTELAFSSDSGASWTGPNLITSIEGGTANLASAVSANGQGWAAWTKEESIYAQQFVAGDAVPPPPPPPPPIVPPVVTPPTPNSGYTIQSIVGNSNGTVTITFVPTQSGEATLVVTVPTASIASASAEAAKAKKCKKGQVKLKGKCLPSTTVTGKASANGTAGVPLKLTVYLSSKIKALLKQGKTVHLTATLTYKSSLGGIPTVKTYSVTVKGKRSHHHK